MDQKSIVVDINKFTPDITGKEKIARVHAVASKVMSFNSDLKSGEVVVDIPADQARWDMETTINNTQGHILNENMNNFETATYEFSVSNVGTTDAGIPIVDGEEFMAEMAKFDQQADDMNATERPLYMMTVKVKTFSSLKTVFVAQSTTGQIHGRRIILNPDQDAEQFTGYWHVWPFSSYDQNGNLINAGADVLIEERLNGNRPTGTDYNPIADAAIWEIVGYNSWGWDYVSPTYNDVFWSGNYISSSYLDAADLNSYMNDYKAILDEYRPNGVNDLYYGRCWVYTVNVNDEYLEMLYGISHFHCMDACIVKKIFDGSAQ
ncbi:MAG: hypothetical protein JEZ03_14520 [Bacteroidales bacterium]|nr:hypothetical protein [Bacteroidales bacterium]